jgi:autoinducer 2-degrading protein
MEAWMIVVHVFIHIKPEFIDRFISLTLENARNSLQEPGIARFDVVQQNDDPERFVLVEIYRTAEDPVRHKETAHYAKWNEAVREMMAEPRYSLKYHNLFPGDISLG